MGSFYGIVVLLHAVGGALFVVTLVIMQLVVGPALGKISPGPDRAAAQGVIQRRWHPVVDAVIIVQSVTAIIILLERWDMIAASPHLQLKITLGIVALVLANLLHFYWRGKKRMIKAQGKTKELQSLGRLTVIIERVVLVCAATTFLLAVSFNHLFQ